MKIYSYMIDHDFGLAPNPFGTYCTLVVCKPTIRRSKNLNVGDWIIGTGSKSLDKSTGCKSVAKLIFAMQVAEILSLNDYWLDKRFQYKKPLMNGTLSTMFGDNFYYLDEKENWVQIDCAHKNVDGIYNEEHIRKDIGGKNALIAENFYYFGDKAPQIPENLLAVCHSTQGVKIVTPEELANQFLDWLRNRFEKGMHGLPISWAMYENNLYKLV